MFCKGCFFEPFPMECVEVWFVKYDAGRCSKFWTIVLWCSVFLDVVLTAKKKQSRIELASFKVLHYPSLLGELQPSPTHWLISLPKQNQTRKPSLNWSAFWPTQKSNPLELQGWRSLPTPIGWSSKPGQTRCSQAVAIGTCCVWEEELCLERGHGWWNG